MFIIMGTVSVNQFKLNDFSLSAARGRTIHFWSLVKIICCSVLSSLTNYCWHTWKA